LNKKICLLLIILMFFLSACSNSVLNNSTTNNSEIEVAVTKGISLNIVTTDKVLYYMVKSIVQEKHNVEYMFKDKDSQYNFNFTDDSLYNIGNKDLFIYMGASYEPWADDFIGKLNKNKVRVINVSRGVKILPLTNEIKYKDTIITENPYYLMNYDNFKIALLNIKNSIQDKDPQNRDFYEKNFNDTISSTELDQKSITDTISKLSDYTFVYSEDEIEYFVKYNISNNIKLTAGNSNANIKNPEKTVFIYCNSDALKANEEFIKKYNLNTLNIRVPENDLSYEDILLLNKSLFIAYYNSVNIKK
jgi:zinc/manganese transport system substrate-binding protein